MRPSCSKSPLPSAFQLCPSSTRVPRSGIVLPSLFVIAVLLTPAIQLFGQLIGSPFDPPRFGPPPVQTSSAVTQQEIRLAGDYLVGRGVQKDPIQAAYWYRKAADQGDPEAQNQLGYLYTWGIGVARDPAEAFRWFARAAGYGCQSAKLNLAVLYFRGAGTPRDVPLAVDLLNQLAEKGNARAAAYLGILYLTGSSIPRDQARAEKWLGKAAKAKNPEAEYSMGVLWSSGSSHEHDPAKAVKFLRDAARHGYVPAMHALGLFLEQNSAIAPNPPDEAVSMLERAAQAGYWTSSATLGSLARDGHERPQNLADAFRWFTIASRQGGSAAQKFTSFDLDRCRHALTEEEQNRELTAADSWLAEHPHTDLFLFGAQESSKSSQFPIDEIYAPGAGGQ